MDERIEAVWSALLIDGVGLTLVRIGDTWRFSSWHRGADGLTKLLPPTPEDCRRAFATVEDAVAYFRNEYGETLKVQLSRSS